MLLIKLAFTKLTRFPTIVIALFQQAWLPPNSLLGRFRMGGSWQLLPSVTGVSLLLCAPLNSWGIAVRFDSTANPSPHRWSAVIWSCMWHWMCSSRCISVSLNCYYWVMLVNCYSCSLARIILNRCTKQNVFFYFWLAYAILILIYQLFFASWSLSFIGRCQHSRISNKYSSTFFGFYCLEFVLGHERFLPFLCSQRAAL